MLTWQPNPTRATLASSPDNKDQDHYRYSKKSPFHLKDKNSEKNQFGENLFKEKPPFDLLDMNSEKPYSEKLNFEKNHNAKLIEVLNVCKFFGRQLILW